MIHDILISCLNLSCSGESLKKFLDSKAVDVFINPWEREIYEDILKILSNLRSIVKFTKYFGTQSQTSDFPDANEFSSGNYIKYYAKGIESALDDYYLAIMQLEKQYNEKSNLSFLRIYHCLEGQMPLINHLQDLINDAKILKLHGCTLLNKHSTPIEYGNPQSIKTLAKIFKPVKMIFFSHLNDWLILGIIDDPHAEFFINYRQYSKGESQSFSEKSSPSNNSNASIGDGGIWQFEINVRQLPVFMSLALAEKILFVGQTVHMFKQNRLNGIKSYSRLTNGLFSHDVQELWGDQKSIFAKKIADLNRNVIIDDIRMATVLNEMKKFVSQRLRTIAAIEDDLDHHMCLIKDFYLLGRGEFYLEFLRQLSEMSEINNKSYTKAFQVAKGVMGISEELENFTLTVVESATDLDESCEFGFLQNLYLKYTYKWPLNLLLSSTIIDRYNIIFRFLLTVQKIQHDLLNIWARHKWLLKLGATVDIHVMNFRHHLTFFVDNLQYYIQMDVLESQFSKLIKTIRNKEDFEEIQRSHSVFLANVLSDCFLLTDAVDRNKDNTDTATNPQYPVYGTILEIFGICDKFCQLDLLQDTTDKLSQIANLEERFTVAISFLIRLLVDIQSTVSIGALSQFLVRLDFNRWFSSKKTETNESQ